MTKSEFLKKFQDLETNFVFKHGIIPIGLFEFHFYVVREILNQITKMKTTIFWSFPTISVVVHRERRGGGHRTKSNYFLICRHMSPQ